MSLLYLTTWHSKRSRAFSQAACHSLSERLWLTPIIVSSSTLASRPFDQLMCSTQHTHVYHTHTPRIHTTYIPHTPPTPTRTHIQPQTHKRTQTTHTTHTYTRNTNNKHNTYFTHLPRTATPPRTLPHPRTTSPSPHTRHMYTPHTHTTPTQTTHIRHTYIPFTHTIYITHTHTHSHPHTTSHTQTHTNHTHVKHTPHTYITHHTHTHSLLCGLCSLQYGPSTWSCLFCLCFQLYRKVLEQVAVIKAQKEGKGNK